MLAIAGGILIAVFVLFVLFGFVLLIRDAARFAFRFWHVFLVLAVVGLCVGGAMWTQTVAESLVVTSTRH